MEVMIIHARHFPTVWWAPWERRMVTNPSRRSRTRSQLRGNGGWTHWWRATMNSMQGCRSIANRRKCINYISHWIDNDKQNFVVTTWCFVCSIHQLIPDAQAWSEKLEQECKMYHLDESMRLFNGGPLGENVMGNETDQTVAAYEASDKWYDNRSI